MKYGFKLRRLNFKNKKINLSYNEQFFTFYYFINKKNLLIININLFFDF